MKKTILNPLVLMIIYSVVGLLLIALKAFGVIDCSWWLATAPIYGPIIILLLPVLGLFIAHAILSKMAKRNGNR